MSASNSEDMTYLITGASSGIGLELVRQLALQGKKVLATVRTRKSSATGVDEISTIQGDVTVLEGIDVSSDEVGATLISALSSIQKIDVVVHNAGSLSGTREVEGSELFKEQSLSNVTMNRMRSAFEVNTLGPLRVQQALLQANLMPNGGKVAIISTGLSSIEDNASGGNYAYRTSKAAVNMISKCLSCDLKEKGVSVMAVAPGFVATEFGPGREKMASFGGMPVDVSVRGVVSLLNTMTMETTGSFYCVQKDSTAKEYPW
mmetsp:Transcript_7601/g.11051  ORF Transcript_7601/g.11051 Transcript_7601/m.11051 type:complete len:261 (+) Transcript_7601:223-1005(+)|eukprot:CAMPEP_0194220070 /NCGR_PEP_ID=MMETSP0156-20130528/27382_1 /TAXON_ID=33649 /ORGANISM="Thalassionema nitzschioides, Strain L26-B" /LENGTH=260 /DNA_ID=CAMNT_0038949945 /DNA_START=184 /DNA_END=966 /DNA_ORIENTATION=-